MIRKWRNYNFPLSCRFSVCRLAQQRLTVTIEQKELFPPMFSVCFHTDAEHSLIEARNKCHLRLLSLFHTLYLLPHWIIQPHSPLLQPPPRPRSGYQDHQELLFSLLHWMRDKCDALLLSLGSSYSSILYHDDLFFPFRITYPCWNWSGLKITFLQSEQGEARCEMKRMGTS